MIKAKGTSMKGFTLIEMMIVVALIAIVASFAVPAYQDKIRKARRADGIAALSGLQMSMEKFRGNCAFFPDGFASTDACGTSSAASDIEYPSASPDGNYTISFTSASGNTFVIQADPTGAQAADTDCDPISLTVNNSNPKGLKAPTKCWR
jgi:type IV pilus assembly protein PilE